MRPLQLLCFLIGLALLAGCAGEDPARPPAPTGATTGEVTGVSLDDWSDVVTRWVEPGAAAEIQGSRYRLVFSEKSLRKAVLVTVKERDTKIADVELGPDGTRFDEPVRLEIDYEGTSSDPADAGFHGRAPAVFYHNPVTGTWEEMPSKVDPETKRIVVLLEHFSRYAMYEPTAEGEWQWTQQGPPVRGGAEVSAH